MVKQSIRSPHATYTEGVLEALRDFLLPVYRTDLAWGGKGEEGREQVLWSRRQQVHGAPI
jgi:hypothetical protein